MIEQAVSIIVVEYSIGILNKSILLLVDVVYNDTSHIFNDNFKIELILEVNFYTHYTDVSLGVNSANCSRTNLNK